MSDCKDGDEQVGINFYRGFNVMALSLLWAGQITAEMLNFLPRTSLVERAVDTREYVRNGNEVVEALEFRSYKKELKEQQ